MAEAYLDRGATRKGQGDRDGAIADCNKAIEINPATPTHLQSGHRPG